MPNHVHLLAEGATAAAVSAPFQRALSGCGRDLWEPFPPPSVIPDLKHLRRHIRYVHLNPCREGLVRDPLEWEFSTHREVVGAAPPGWMELDTLRKAWGVRRPDALPALVHAYVSADPAVRVEGTPLPARRPLGRLIADFPELGAATLQSLRAPAQDLRRRSVARRLWIHIASGLPMARPSAIARELGVGRTTVHWNLTHPLTPSERAAVAAAELLLSAPDRFGLNKVFNSGGSWQPKRR
jgi:hypothetical protein